MLFLRISIDFDFWLRVEGNKYFNIFCFRKFFKNYLFFYYRIWRWVVFFLLGNFFGMGFERKCFGLFYERERENKSFIKLICGYYKVVYLNGIDRYFKKFVICNC